MESYRFGNIDEAIEMLQSLKKQGKNKKVVVFTVDFDANLQNKKIATPEEGCMLVKKSNTIIINEDTYISHMQLFSIKQDNIKNIIKEGIMHDLIFSG